MEKSSKADADKQEKQDKKTKALQQEVYLPPSLILPWLSSCVVYRQESYHTACCRVMEPIMEYSRLLHPAKVWEDINHRLYSTFWALSLYDLYVPTGRYDDEISRAKQACRDIENNNDLVGGTVNLVSLDK